MEFWAYPYLFRYLAMFLFWMLGAHRQILFWLYLWQLKEYHLGRFLAHFETAKGKGLFLNPLAITKIAVAAASVAYFSLTEGVFLPLVAIAAIFIAQAARTVFGFFQLNPARPKLTKKSGLLIGATHVLIFGAGFIVFNSYLGEMSLPDVALAAIILLLLDILLPLAVALTVLLLQPLTILEKNRILRRAESIIKDRNNLVAIGIAGSYGKSVTKELVAGILEKRFKVLKTAANQNTEIGVAQAIISKLKLDDRFFVCEIGAVHKGRIRQVAGIINPRIGVLTGINQQHMGVFGNQKNIIDGKFELLEALPQNGIAVLNWNNRLIQENFELKKGSIKTGNIIRAGKDLWASDVKTAVSNLSFTVNYKNKTSVLNTNARGAYMAEPILLAMASAMAAGMDFDEVIGILNKTDFTPYNIKTRRNTAGINVLDSTYSSNPNGVIAHLDYLKLWPGKKAIVMPCLIELGKSSKEVHFQIGQRIAGVCELAVVTTKDRFNEIKKGALSAGMNSDDIICSENPDGQIKKRLGAGDTILLEGRITPAIADIFN